MWKGNVLLLSVVSLLLPTHATSKAKWYLIDTVESGSSGVKKGLPGVLPTVSDYSDGDEGDDYGYAPPPPGEVKTGPNPAADAPTVPGALKAGPGPAAAEPAAGGGGGGGGGGAGRCEVREGPGKGGACVFPFTFKGKEYTTCTAEGTGKQYNIGSWCPTVANDSMGPYSDTFGICPEDCPGSKPRITACNSYGEEVCRFPYQHSGYTYSGCILIGGKPSCMNRFGQPMACSDECPLDTELESKDVPAADIAKLLSTTGAGHFKSSKDQECGAQLIKIWKDAGMDAVEDVKKNCYPFNKNGRFLMAKRSGTDSSDCEILCAKTE